MKKLTFFSAVQLFVILLISVALVFLLYDTLSLIHNITNRNQLKTQDFTHHIAVISEYEDASSVNAICRGAEDESFTYNAVIDNLVPKTGAEDTGLQKLFDYAAAMNVDGIIAYVSDSHTKINPPVTFNGSQIPVVLIGNNIQEGTALAHIDTNAYDLGLKISDSLQLLLPQGGKILVVYNSSKIQEMFLRVMSGFHENAFLAERCKMQFLDIQTADDLNIDDKIREVIRGDSSLQAVVCLSFNETIRVAETIVDLNLAGKIKIIGLGDTEKNRMYLQKGIISALISLQYEQMGKLAVDRIFEYMSSGYTNSYTAIAVDVLTGRSDAAF